MEAIKKMDRKAVQFSYFYKIAIERVVLEFNLSSLSECHVPQSFLTSSSINDELSYSHIGSSLCSIVVFSVFSLSL